MDMSRWEGIGRRDGVSGEILVPARSFGGDATRHLTEGLVGADAEALCREVGIAVERLDDPEYRVDVEMLLELCDRAQARTADPLIALHAGERVRFGSLASYLVGSQRTLGEALEV